MQSQLQSSFQRVEQALQRLTDSIAAYHPSVSAAEELEAADHAVDEDLRQLVIHQRNHLRKEALRRQTDAYDADIKGKIRQLFETRRELANIAAYTPGESSTREVDVGELLRYAKYISKTTVPPTLPKQEASSSPAVKQDEGRPQLANGTSTPPPETQQSQDSRNGVVITAEETGEEGSDTRFINQETRAKTTAESNFFPWPHYGMISGGALGAIQRMVEDGKDPGGVLSAEEQTELERQRAEEEEKERVGREERVQRAGGGGSGRRRQEVVEDVFNPDDM